MSQKSQLNSKNFIVISKLEETIKVELYYEKQGLKSSKKVSI